MNLKYKIITQDELTFLVKNSEITDENLKFENKEILRVVNKYFINANITTNNTFGNTHIKFDNIDISPKIGIHIIILTIFKDYDDYYYIRFTLRYNNGKTPEVNIYKVDNIDGLLEFIEEFCKKQIDFFNNINKLIELTNQKKLILKKMNDIKSKLKINYFK